MGWLTSAALAAFVLIVPVELPDKTFVATLVLSTRYRPLTVWLGVVAAFGVQCAIAVAAGRLLRLLPERPVQLVAAALFVVGAVILFRDARNAEAEEAEAERELASGSASPAADGGRPVASFVVLFTAEWGDLSQLLTAGLVASGRPAGAGVLRRLGGARVRVGRGGPAREVAPPAGTAGSVVRYCAAGLCAVLAVITTMRRSR